MRRYLPWVLVAVSMALNAFFIGGHFYARRLAEMHGGPAPWGMGHGASEMMDRLGFDTEQRRALTALRQSMREANHAGRAADRELGLALLDEALKPSPDPAAVDKLTDQLNQRRLAHLRSAVPRLSGFLATLTPEQRQRVREVAETRGPMFLLLGQGGAGDRPPPRPPG